MTARAPAALADALKPCPFPHEGTDLLEGSWPAKHQYWIHCPCGAMGPICDSPEKARDRWNTRTPSPSWDEAIARAIDARLHDSASEARTAIILGVIESTKRNPA